MRIFYAAKVLNEYICYRVVCNLEPIYTDCAKSLLNIQIIQ